MNTKKICIISQNLYELGGVQRTISEICNNLMNREDIELSILMSTNNKEKSCFYINEAVNIIEISDVFIEKFVPLYKPFNMVNRRTKILDNIIGVRFAKNMFFRSNELDKLVGWINNEKFDVVIGATAIYALLVGFIADRIDAKTIGWMHSTYEGYYCMRGQNLYGSEKLSMKMLGKLDRLFVLNSFDQKKFEKKCNVKCDILYNPIKYSLKKENSRKKYDLIFVGRLNEQVKGLDYLIDIISKIKKDVKNDIKCMIVGDGKDRGYLEECVLKNNLEDNIKLVGFQKNVTRYYMESKMLISTSRWEGFGLTIIEAMACGVPCIAFDNEGPAEIIEDGQNGILVPKYDTEYFAKAIKECFVDEKKYEVLSKNAVERAKDFDIKKIVDRFLNLIKDVCYEQ